MTTKQFKLTVSEEISGRTYGASILVDEIGDHNIDETMAIIRRRLLAWSEQSKKIKTREFN